MRIYGVVISIISLSFFSFSRDGEELKILDDLIASSERQLTIQKELRALIVKFQFEQDLFYQGPEKGQKTREIVSKMVDTAMEIQKLAEDNHYLHLLPAYFLDGLQQCVNIGKKRNPPVVP
jgi:hypothetical protein